MKNAKKKYFVLGALITAGAYCSHAQPFSPGQSDGTLNAANDVYNNLTGNSPAAGLVMTNGEELGNEIFMPVSPNDNYMTNFTFEYFGSSTSGANFTGTVGLDIKFYLNTGPALNGYLSPSATPFYEWNSSTVYSGQKILPTGNAELGNITIGSSPAGSGLSTGTSWSDGVLIPYTSGENLTYTITFTGLAAGDQIGLTTLPGSAIGTVRSGYWLDNNGAGFQYLTNGVDDASMAEIQAVPEPSSLALVGVAGLSLLADAKRRFVK